MLESKLLRAVPKDMPELDMNGGSLSGKGKKKQAEVEAEQNQNK
jgi:hypothetical protein